MREPSYVREAEQVEALKEKLRPFRPVGRVLLIIGGSICVIIFVFEIMTNPARVGEMMLRALGRGILVAILAALIGTAGRKGWTWWN